MNQALQGWQVMLADLSMILFLVTASTLPGGKPVISAESASSSHGAPGAVFRSGRGQSLTLWLDERVQDPREMLTLTGRYGPGERSLIARDVAIAAAIADRRGVAVRTVLEPGTRSDLVAVLAFDRTDIAQE